MPVPTTAAEGRIGRTRSARDERTCISGRGATISTQMQGPARLASEDVIINAPMSYAGSAQRIMRIRRWAHGGGQLAAITLVATVLVLVAWTFVTAWYLTWGLLLVPYRLIR